MWKFTKVSDSKVNFINQQNDNMLNVYEFFDCENLRKVSVSKVNVENQQNDNLYEHVDCG